jgi:DNA-binding NtrC family response regulator
MKNLWERFLIQDELIGSSPALFQIRRSIPVMGKGENHVMISGDPGTEKLLVAKLIIMNSMRKDAPVFITDAAKLNRTFDEEIHATLLEHGPSEMNTVHGTLVVQNLEFLEPAGQVRLMSLAQGGYLESSLDKRSLATDLRVISTASPHIHTMANESLFDSELLLTLGSTIVKIPSLRERKQDVLHVFEFYLNHFCQALSRPIPPIPFEIFHQILKYAWPGNVKEVENVVRSLVIASPDGQLLVEALPFFNQASSFHRVELQNLNSVVSHLESEMIERALRRFAGNQSRAAQVLHLSEPNLRFKMKKLGIHKKDFVMGTD